MSRSAGVRSTREIPPESQRNPKNLALPVNYYESARELDRQIDEEKRGRAEKHFPRAQAINVREKIKQPRRVRSKAMHKMDQTFKSEGSL